MMEQFIETWRSGQVVRKHTMENIRAENVAEHTWGVMTLLLAAWPDATRQIVLAAQFHDVGEIATGDMPGPVKWANPILEREMEKLEKIQREKILPGGIRLVLSNLTEAECAVVEFFDRAEFCVSMARERRLGNTYAMLYFNRSFNKMCETLDRWGDDFMEISPFLHSGMLRLKQEIVDEQHALGVL